MQLRLTEDGDNNDNKIEDVPRLLEEVQSKTDELEDTLAGEDDDERRVDDVQAVLTTYRPCSNCSDCS